MGVNIRLYPAYLVLTRLDFWMPVFFLYFMQRFGFDRAIQLEAIYYAAVVLLEVPSGYFSDRFGRKITLIAATLAGAFSGLIFATASTYTFFVTAQILFAFFIAFNSGSDTSLLYDSLKAEGREAEILTVEADAHSKALLFGAAGSIIGGVSAYYGGYRAAYVLSGLAFAAAAFMLIRFTEPPKTGDAPETTIVSQIGACLSKLSNRALAWLTVYYVGRTVFEHIPYEFFQPFLQSTLPAAAVGTVAIISGAHLATTRLVSSWFANRAASLARQWGSATILIFTNTLVTALILLMAFWVHPIVVVLLLARNVAHGLGESVMNAAIHPRVESGLRATYLSLQSLAGRLMFSGALVVASYNSGMDGDPASMGLILKKFGTLSIILIVWLKWATPEELNDAQQT